MDKINNLCSITSEEHAENFNPKANTESMME